MTYCRIRCWRCCSPPIAKAGEALRHTSFAQPALFAVEMGLARLWQSWGIEPDVVLGHSVGQYAAACVAGVFSLEDGARLMAERGRLFGSLPEGGRMVAVFTDAKHVEEVADEFPRVSVAAYNGPNTVLSGPGEDLEQIVARFGDDGNPLHLAGDQPRLPFGVAGSGARRIRVVRSAVAVRRCRRCRWSATAPAPCSRPKPRSTLNTGGGIPASRCNSPKVCAPWRRWDARC